jgi:energy-coupling factor transport system ATP-binding protein
MSNNIIEVKNLCFSYSSKKETIADVSFVVEKGKYISIVGHNGSGKSTIAKLLIGLLEKKSGEVIVDSLSLNKENLYKIRNKIALVFQNPDNQFIGATVEDDIAFGLENRNVPSEKMQGIIDEYADAVGMKDFLKKEPSNLSGGQKQRVAIAGALALSPSILILDEATSMLDPKGKREIRELINKMRKNNPDLTVISITHDIEEAFNSDEVIVIHQGKVAFSGEPTTVFKNRELLDKFELDVPFVIDIIMRLRNEGILIDENIKDLDSLAEALWELK